MRTNEELLVEIEAADEGRGPDPIHTVVGEELAAIAVSGLAVKAAEARLDAAVAAARAAGQSWQAIGDVLGLTRQGALKRYRKTAA